MILGRASPSNGRPLGYREEDAAAGGVYKAWLAASVILGVIVAAVTVLPVRFRPRTGHGNAERLLAFGVVGGAMARALSGRPALAAVNVVAMALLLESVQLLVPSRHGRLEHVLQKSAGGIAGVAIGNVLDQARRQTRSRRRRGKSADLVLRRFPLSRRAGLGDR